MELVTDFSQYEQDSSTRRVKSRSKACLHCRRRKMRCDGVKPSCFQCVRAERASECEYDDGITKTSTQLLYERLATLEKRYRDLQAAKRPSQSRRAPSYPRANANSSTRTKDSSDKNLVRSNSVPEGVYSQPRVNGNESYDQSFPDAFIDNSPSFAMTDLGSTLTRSPFISIDDGMPSQPFDMISSSLSSQSSTHSGRSTPSTSDFSHNDAHFHPKYAFAYDTQHELGDQSPYICSNSDLHMNGVTQREMSIPREFQDLPGLPQIPRKLSQSYIFDAVGEIPPALLEHLIDNFIAHSQQAGITLLNHRLLDVLCVTASHVSPALSCCMNLFLLWGAKFSNIEAVRSRQEYFLQGVLSTLPSLLSAPLQVPPELVELHNQDGTTDGRFNVLFATSISVAVATYLFAEGRTIEGSYHANTATQLAICSGIHRTPDPALWRDSSRMADGAYAGTLEQKTFSGFQEISPDPEAVNASRSNTDLIPPPNNLTAALERHHAFWNVFVLDRAWSAAGRLPVPSSRWSVSAGEVLRMGDVLKGKDPRTSITTPWPEDWCLLLKFPPQMEDPQESFSTSPKLPSRSPLEEFLTGADVSPTRSILQLRAKSVALFEVASRITSCRNPERPEAGRNAWVPLQCTVSKFLKILPPLPSHDFRSPSYAKSAPYMIHTLVHAANIRLYSRLAERGYKEGLIDNPTAVFARGTSGTAVQRVIDGLLGYERVFSQHGPGGENTNPSQVTQSPGECVAAVDQCLSSAREVVRIANCITPDDISFLEPMIAPCWALASQVLLRELKRLSDAHQHTDSTNLLAEIRTLETSLKYLGAIFAIGNIEARKITSALANIISDNTSSAT